MEMASRIRNLQRIHQFALVEARMAIKEKQLDYTVREMDTAVNSPETLARISQHAHSMNDDLLTEMSGKSVAPKDDTNDGYYGDRGFGRR
jgi:hypothetical protein